METRLRSLIKEAMIKKNKNKQIAYKSILENAQKLAKMTNSAVTDADIVRATKSEIKSLNDLRAFVQDGTEKAIEIDEKIAYCKVMLPQMASEEEVRAFLLENKDNISNIGAAMKALKEKFGDNLDGKSASAIAKSMF